MALKYLYVPSGVQATKAYGVLPNSANADFDDFSRNSAGSRVDKNGFINTGLGLGSEEVVNGDFDTDSDWNKGTGWNIANGVATYDGTGGTSNIQQNLSISINTSYEVKITVISNEGTGTNIIEIGNDRINDDHLDAGTYTFYGTSTSGTSLLIYGRSGEEFVIDNVSVREVTEVNTNVPRLDYTDGGCPSLLLEPTSTNYFQYSEDFSQSYWQHNADITTTNSSELAPNGGLNANLIEYDGSGYSFIRLYMTVPSTAATLSVFAKKGNWRYLGLRNFQASGSDHTVFDFDTETFSNIASGQTASFEVFPDGWYRIKVTHPSPESNSIVGFAISNSSGSESNTTGGQVANVHLFGAQLEHQSYATSYIPNYGTSAGVTRSQDASGNTGDISVDIDSGEGVFFAEIAYFDADQQGFPHISISDGTADNRISIQKQSSTTNLIAFSVRDTNVGQCFLQESTIDKSNYFKIAGKYKQDDFALFINGNKINTDTSGSVPTGLNTFSFDKGNTFSKFVGRVKQVRIYDEALSDSELEELTTL